MCLRIATSQWKCSNNNLAHSKNIKYSLVWYNYPIPLQNAQSFGIHTKLDLMDTATSQGLKFKYASAILALINSEITALELCILQIFQEIWHSLNTICWPAHCKLLRLIITKAVILCYLVHLYKYLSSSHHNIFFICTSKKKHLTIVSKHLEWRDSILNGTLFDFSSKIQYSTIYLQYIHPLDFSSYANILTKLKKK